MKKLAQDKSSASLVSRFCKALPRVVGGVTFSLLALAATTASAEPMKVQGRQLLDACGNPFVVRGVEQILGRELPPGNDWLGVIDEILPEPVGGAHRDPKGTFRTVGEGVARALKTLEKTRPKALLDARLDKFDRMGAFVRVGEPVAAHGDGE